MDQRKRYLSEGLMSPGNICVTSQNFTQGRQHTFQDIVSGVHTVCVFEREREREREKSLRGIKNKARKRKRLEEKNIGTRMCSRRHPIYYLLPNCLYVFFGGGEGREETQTHNPTLGFLLPTAFWVGKQTEFQTVV